MHSTFSFHLCLFCHMYLIYLCVNLEGSLTVSCRHVFGWRSLTLETNLNLCTCMHLNKHTYTLSIYHPSGNFCCQSSKFRLSFCHFTVTRYYHIHIGVSIDIVTTVRVLRSSGRIFESYIRWLRTSVHVM